MGAARGSGKVASKRHGGHGAQNWGARVRVSPQVGSTHLFLAADLRHDLLLLDLGLALLGAIGCLQLLLELAELLGALADLLDQLFIAELLDLAAVELPSDPLLLFLEGLLAEVVAVLLWGVGKRPVRKIVVGLQEGLRTAIKVCSRRISKLAAAISCSRRFWSTRSSDLATSTCAARGQGSGAGRRIRYRGFLWLTILRWYLDTSPISFSNISRCRRASIWRKYIRDCVDCTPHSS